MATWDTLLTNVNLATMTGGDASYGAIEHGAPAIRDGRIAWLGAAADLAQHDAREVIDGAGGGIARTVTATRQASHDELTDAAARRLACLLAEGVTTVEIKSGYGLDRNTEIKMLEVARRLGYRLIDHRLELYAIPLDDKPKR